jgi:3',5'-cyclic AMP phosphodiesterase CpdA
VSFVPGNHDNYVRSSAVPLYRALGPWMTGDDGAPASAPTFPYLRRRDGVALVGANSAVPTLPFLASGRVGPQQLARLADLLSDLGREGLCRVVMIHHAPYRSATSPARQLIDAAAFERVVARVGAELILHGHNHRIQLTRLAGPERPVPALGAPSSSAYAGARQHRAGYHLVDITPDGARSSILVRSRGLKPGGQIAELTALGEISGA